LRVYQHFEQGTFKKMKFPPGPHLSLVVFFLIVIPLNAQVKGGSVDSRSQHTGVSVVRGRVVYVDNSQPLKGARVEVFSSDHSGVRLTTNTNDRGEFQIDGLVAGKYYVNVMGPGVPRPSGFGMRIPLPIAAIPRAEDYPEIVPRHDAVFAVDGSNTAEIEVRVPRGGSLSGKVMKSDGSPVSNVVVHLVSREGATGPYMARFSTQTNHKGVYKFENVLPAEYLVSAATATDDKSGNLDILARIRGEYQIVTFHPAATRLGDALTVKVDPGRESAGVNITLVERKTLSVSGTLIRGRDGSPVAGAAVVLRNKNAELTGPLMPGMGDRRTESSSDGKWSFSNVDPGDYEVTALTPTGPTPTRIGPVVGQPGPRMSRPSILSRTDPGPRPRYLIAQQQISLVNADLDDLTLVIGGVGRIRGVVETENGEALPNNLTLFFEFLTEGPRPGRPEPVRVLPDGSFVLENVSSGNRQMMAGLPSGSPFYVVSTTSGEKELSETPLLVVEDAESGVVRVRISSQFATISGSVTTDSMGGADVVVLLVPSDVAKQRFRIAYIAVQTAPDGSFTAKVPPGKYLVVPRRRANVPTVITPEFMRSLGHDIEAVSLLPDEQKTVQLRLSQR
jgi:Carboxypeptidase regulatory-like domain